MSKRYVFVPAVVSVAATTAGLAAQISNADGGAAIAAVVSVGEVAANVLASFLHDHWGPTPSTPEELAASALIRQGVADVIRDTILAAANGPGDLPAYERGQLRELAQIVGKRWPMVEMRTMEEVVTMVPEQIPVSAVDCFQRHKWEILTVEVWHAFLHAASPETEEWVLDHAAEELYKGLIPNLTTYLATGDATVEAACKKLTLRLLERLMKFANEAETHEPPFRPDQRKLLEQFQADAGPLVLVMEQADALLPKVSVSQGEPAQAESSATSPQTSAKGSRPWLAGVAGIVLLGGAALGWKLLQGRTGTTDPLGKTIEPAGTTAVAPTVTTPKVTAPPVNGRKELEKTWPTMLATVRDLQRDLREQKRSVREFSDEAYLDEIEHRTGWNRPLVVALLAAAAQNQDPSLQADSLLIQRNTADAYRLSTEAGEKKRTATPPLVMESARDFLRAGRARIQEDAFRPALAELEKAQGLVESVDGQVKEPELWGEIRQAQGDSLQRLAESVEGEEADRLNQSAVAAYRDALRAFDTAKAPRSWVAAQHDLGVVLAQSAAWLHGDDALNHYRKAAEMLLGDLKIIDAEAATADGAEAKEDYAQKRGMTWNNLGRVYLEESQLQTGTEAQKLAQQALEAYQSALSTRTREQRPWRWAASQNGLGLALSQLAKFSTGDESTKYLGSAVNDFQSAQEIFTRGADPKEWAMVSVNLGTAHELWSQRTSGKESASECQQAADAYGKALEVLTKKDAPAQWAKVLNNLGNVRQQQYIASEEDGKERYLAMAVDSYQKLLEYLTKEKSPREWAMTCNNLGNAYRKWGAVATGDAAQKYLHQAVANHERALEVRTREASPQEWGDSQVNLASVRFTQAQKADTEEDAAELYGKAAESYAAALEVQTRQGMPLGWAQAQYRLGTTYYQQGLLARRADAQDLFQKSGQRIEGALEVFRKAAPGWVAEAEQQRFLATCEIAYGQKNWTEAADGYSKLAAKFPEARRYYQSLANVYHEGLHDFTKAYEIHERWLKDHPDDESTQLNFIEAHFTNARFADCVQLGRRLQPALYQEGRDFSASVAMRVLEIASLLAQGDERYAGVVLGVLQTEIAAQQDPAFTVHWTWDGSRYFIEHTEDPGVAKYRKRLLLLLDATQESTRDKIVAKLKTAWLKAPEPKAKTTAPKGT